MQIPVKNPLPFLHSLWYLLSNFSPFPRFPGGLCSSELVNSPLVLIGFESMHSHLQKIWHLSSKKPKLQESQAQVVYRTRYTRNAQNFWKVVEAFEEDLGQRINSSKLEAGRGMFYPKKRGFLHNCSV